MGRLNRRALFRNSLLVAGGAGATVLAEKIPHWVGPDRLPIDGGYAPTEDHGGLIKSGQVVTTWFVPTDEPVVALTFDDGPQPDWTPMVLDLLDEVQASATFFMIGEHLQANRALVAGRMDRHVVGNHTWTHCDLAEQDVESAMKQFSKAHEEITRTIGREPTIMRPPWGHLGGAAMLAANAMHYNVILWSREMHPETFTDTKSQVDDIVQNAVPGTIVLAHDVGLKERLSGLRGVADIVRGLRGRGFRVVTVPEMLALTVA